MQKHVAIYLALNRPRCKNMLPSIYDVLRRSETRFRSSFGLEQTEFRDWYQALLQGGISHGQKVVATSQQIQSPLRVLEDEEIEG